MHTRLIGRFILFVAASLVTGLLVSPAGASVGFYPASAVSGAPLGPGAKLWAARYANEFGGRAPAVRMRETAASRKEERHVFWGQRGAVGSVDRTVEREPRAGGANHPSRLRVHRIPMPHVAEGLGGREALVEWVKQTRSILDGLRFETLIRKVASRPAQLILRTLRPRAETDRYL
jgi:hypothetical protein